MTVLTIYRRELPKGVITPQVIQNTLNDMEELTREDFRGIKRISVMDYFQRTTLEVMCYVIAPNVA